MESDHKPLEMIHLKSMHNVPLLLQRMLLQLQKYDMTIKVSLYVHLQNQLVLLNGPQS